MAVRSFQEDAHYPERPASVTYRTFGAEASRGSVHVPAHGFQKGVRQVR